jgi:ribosomal protein S27E
MMTWRSVLTMVTGFLRIEFTVRCPQCHGAVITFPVGTKVTILAHTCGYHRKIAQ